MAINTEMSDALRLFVGDVPGLENNLNSKYHKNSKWYPEASVEGGTKTVGFGHKLGKNPEVDELVRRQGYLTDEQNQAAFYKRGTVAFNDAKAVYDAEIGRGSFDRLDSRVQAVLTDYAYNLGRSGFAKYRKFMHGIANGDFDQIQKEYVRHVNGKPLGNRNAWALGLLASVYDAPKSAAVENKVEGRPFMSAGQYYYPASDYSRALVEQQHRIYNMEHPQNPMVAGIERMRAKGYPRGEGDAYDGATNAALAGILAGGIGLGRAGIDATSAMLNRAFTPKTGVGKAAETLFDSYITVDSANELGKKISGQPSETSLADDLWGLGIAAVPVTKVVGKIAGVTPVSALYAEGGPLAWRNEAPAPQEQKVAPDAPVPYTRDMFRTKLDPVEEQLFKRWYSKVSKRLGISEDPDAPEHHYDYRGYWRKEGRNVPAIFMGRNWHFPDTYKTPWHETFSTDSIYSTPEHTGGTWDGDKFIDSDWTRSVRETGNYLSVGGKLDFINNKVVKWLADGGDMSSKGAAELSQWLADNGFAGVLNIPEAPNVFATGGSTDREERKRNKSLTEAILRKAENERKAKLIASGHPQDAPLIPMEQEIMGWTDAGDAMAIGEAIYRRDPILGAAAVAGAVLPGVSSKAIRKAINKAKTNKANAFVSELDWSPESWFSTRRSKTWDKADVDELLKHIDEYNEIERVAKENGTWLKNSDGSTFTGDPRVWVMSRSKNAIEGLEPETWYSGILGNTIPDHKGNYKNVDDYIRAAEDYEYPTSFKFWEGEFLALRDAGASDKELDLAVKKHREKLAAEYNALPGSKEDVLRNLLLQQETWRGPVWGTDNKNVANGFGTVSQMEFRIPKQKELRTIDMEGNSWNDIPYVFNKETGSFEHLSGKDPTTRNNERNMLSSSKNDKYRVLGDTNDLVNIHGSYGSGTGGGPIVDYMPYEKYTKIKNIREGRGAMTETGEWIPEVFSNGDFNHNIAYPIVNDIVVAPNQPRVFVLGNNGALSGIGSVYKSDGGKLYGNGGGLLRRFAEGLSYLPSRQKAQQAVHDSIQAAANNYEIKYPSFGGFGNGMFGGAGASGRFEYSPSALPENYDYVRNTPIMNEVTFSQAYANARRAGLPTFKFNGQTYTTDYDPNAKLGPVQIESNVVANLREVLDRERKTIPDSTRLEPWVGQIPGEVKRKKSKGGHLGRC